MPEQLLGVADEFFPIERADEAFTVEEEFLASHSDFKLLNASAILSQQQINLDTGKYLKLLPHIHHTDGFFAAVFEKVDPAAAPVNASKDAEKNKMDVEVESLAKLKTKKAPAIKKGNAIKSEVTESMPVKTKAVAKSKVPTKALKEKILKDIPAKEVEVKAPKVKAITLNKVEKPKTAKAIKE